MPVVADYTGHHRIDWTVQQVDLTAYILIILDALSEQIRPIPVIGNHSGMMHGVALN